MRLGFVAELPPAPTGLADYLAGLLPWLSTRAETICFVADPEQVDPRIRATYPVRGLAERGDPEVDVLVYQCGNNLENAAVLRAALEGPPGVVLLHDASLHWALRRSLEPEAFRDLLFAAHGEAARALLDLQDVGFRGRPEDLLFDCLAAVLGRHRGAVVHDERTAALVRRRVPGLPVFVVPHYAAPPPAETLPRRALGLPADRVVVGHLGFIGMAKRPDVLVAAGARLIERSLPIHLLFAGEDRTEGRVERAIREHGLEDRVTLTGYVPPDRLSDFIAATDVVVNLRRPNNPQASGMLARSLAAGRATVISELSWWADIPEDACVRIRTGGDQAVRLAAALAPLVVDAGARTALGAAALHYAQGHLDPGSCAGKLVDAARSAHASAGARAERTRGVADFLAGGRRRIVESLDSDPESIPRSIAAHILRYLETFREIPPAPSGGARLLDIGSQPLLLRILSGIWGYEVRGCGLFFGVEPQTVHLPGIAGIPPLTAVFDPVDVERDRLPYPSGSFDVVTCWEVLEHLKDDPMHMLWEINRVLRPNGLLVLTTPNTASLRSVRSAMQGAHPGIWTAYLRAGRAPRHAREYTPSEIRRLFGAAGFSQDGVGTRLVWEEHWDTRTAERLATIGVSLEDRGDDIVAVARKIGLPLERTPAPLYERQTDPVLANPAGGAP